MGKKHNARSEFPLSPDEIQAIINADIPTKTQRRPDLILRDRVLLKVLACLALRATEAANLDWRALDLDRGIATIISEDAKGDKQRVLRFGKMYPDLLSDLRILRGGHRAGPVFRSSRKGAKGKARPITRQRVGQILSAAAAASNVTSPNPDTKVHPHMMRHSWAQNQRRKGMQTAFIQYWLGHSDPATTIKHYGSVTADMMEDEMRRITGATD